MARWHQFKEWELIIPWHTVQPIIIAYAIISSGELLYSNHAYSSLVNSTWELVVALAQEASCEAVKHWAVV
jgi:hypothetical protein